MSYHGLNFGWVELLPNPYIGYMINGCGEIISTYVWAAFASSRLGRRSGMTLTFLLAGMLIFVSLSDVPIIGGVRLGHIAIVIGKMFVDASYIGVYLRAPEIAPASHFGCIFNFATSTGRLGAFFASLGFTIISRDFGTDVPVFLVGMLQVLGAIVSFLLVETKGTKRAITGEDVAERRKAQRFLAIFATGNEKIDANNAAN